MPEFYEFTSWTSIASSRFAHPAIFEPSLPPNYVMSGHRDKRHQDDAFLEDLLKKCDVSGKRGPMHRKKKREQIKQQLMAKDYRFGVARKIMPEWLVDEILEGYIASHNLVPEDSFPCTVPDIGKVWAKDYKFEYVPEFGVFQLCEGMYEDTLQAAAEKHDILLLNPGDSESEEEDGTAGFSDGKVLLLRVDKSKQKLEVPPLERLSAIRVVHPVDRVRCAPLSTIPEPLTAYIAPAHLH